MKRLLILGLVFGLSVATVSANSSYQSEFASVQTSTSFGLQAKSFDSYVQLQWNPVAQTNTKGFIYYKVVRSQSNPSPAYPDDGYVQYSSDAGLSSYKDEKPLSGKTFYRVCAIYEGLTTTGQKSRFCSNVVLIVREGSTINPTESYIQEKKPDQTTEIKKQVEQQVSGGLSQIVKKRLDATLVNFQKALDKRDITNAEKAAIIDKAIARYNSLAKETKSLATKKMALYMVEKLTLMKSQYAEDDTSEIENLLLGL